MTIKHLWYNLFPAPNTLPMTPPSEQDLRRWAWSRWHDYQAWLFHHSFLTQTEWLRLHHQVLNCWRHSPPLISILTPVYNTSPLHLRDCIASVQAQLYPYWEHCLVDDGSSHPFTIASLKGLTARDFRLRVHRFTKNQGICQATNQAISMAKGEYVAFLDHDDRIATDALFRIAEVLRQHPNIDIIYSDRDMISPHGWRFMHLFKPDWSPETLFATNYTCHFTVFRRQFLIDIGKMDAEFEGSQDHDLILRATEANPKVYHIPRVLYHWRQHEKSMALQQDVKEYAIKAAKKSVQKSLERRGLKGEVKEVSKLWRGNFRLHLELPPSETYKVIQLQHFDNYVHQVNIAFEKSTVDYLVFLAKDVEPIDKNAIAELVSWFQIDDVGLVTGKILDKTHKILHAGLVHRRNGLPIFLYEGFDEEAPSYMGVTHIVRNVSSPHPACCTIRRSLWQALEGLNKKYHSPYSLFDFALRALATNSRTVFTPFARFSTDKLQSPDTWRKLDKGRFVGQWQNWLKRGDPYYNPNLTLDFCDMGLDMSLPKPRSIRKL